MEGPVPQYQEVRSVTPSLIANSADIYRKLVKLQQELLPGYAQGVYACLHGGPIHGLLWAFDKIARTKAANGKQIEVLIVHVCASHP